MVHQLVSKDSLVDEDLDGDNDEVKLKEISGSSEAMDLSDIKRRAVAPHLQQFHWRLTISSKQMKQLDLMLS